MNRAALQSNRRDASICSGASDIDPDGRLPVPRACARGTGESQWLGLQEPKPNASPKGRAEQDRSERAGGGSAASFTPTHAEAPGATCAIRFGCRFFPENAFYGCLKIWRMLPGGGKS